VSLLLSVLSQYHSGLSPSHDYPALDTGTPTGMAAQTILLAILPLAAAQVGGIGSSAAPYPNVVYPNATHVSSGAASYQTSPPEYPSPWGEGLGDWGEAYAKAQAFVSGLTLTEKVNLTTGTGWESQKCVGNVGSIPRLGFKALCMQDSPLGVRDTDFNSAFQ
jgi:beta-glucosidase